MTRLFCLREDSSGVPCEAKLMNRRFSNLSAIDAECERLLGGGKWTRIVRVCADIRLQVQFARWAAPLLKVNRVYVLNPCRFVGYIRGCNWNHPCPDYAHYEEHVKGIGNDLWHEFSTYISVPYDEAIRRMTWLMGTVGLRPAEGL